MNKEIILLFHGLHKERRYETDRTDKEMVAGNNEILKSFKKATNIFCPLCGKRKWLYHGEDDTLWQDYPFVCTKCKNAFVIADSEGLI